jgi:hypothetical protein
MSFPKFGWRQSSDTTTRRVDIVNLESTAQVEWGRGVHLYKGTSEQFIADAVEARPGWQRGCFSACLKSQQLMT